MRSRVDFIFWKEGQKYFSSLALNNDKFLYENEYKAFVIILRFWETAHLPLS